MTTTQLGGTRQSSPLENEMTYPLTIDEYLIIKENLSIDKFTNWESFLLTTCISSLVSGIIIYLTGSFIKHEILNDIDTVVVNMQQIIIVIIYGALTVGSILGFIMSKSTKKKTEKPMQRLDNKIMSHINTIKQ